MPTPRSIQTITFDGGCLCFDFINTVGSRLEKPLREYLQAYADVLMFAQRQEILPEQTLIKLGNYAQKQAGEAASVLAEIVTIRENMHQLFSAIVNQRPVSKQVLETFNRSMGMGFSHLEFTPANGSVQVSWRIDDTDLYLPLRMALKSGYDILTGQPAGRIKECSACGWLFLDQTKNNTRRWCDMQTCGSIDKSRRYYQRKKHKT